MVSTRSGKGLEAPQTAGPSGGSRKRKASEPPPKRQRTQPPPFADEATPDSPSRQLFMELDVAVEAVTESSRDSPSRQLLSELNASLSSPSPPSSPHRGRSPARSPSPPRRGRSPAPSPVPSASSSSSSSSSMPPLRGRGHSPRPGRSLLGYLSSDPASDNSSPRTQFDSRGRGGARPIPTPQEVDEKRMLRWVDGRVQAYIKENGPFKTPEDYERVSKIFRGTYRARAPNEPSIDIEAVKAQKLIDAWRKSVAGTPEFIAAKKRQSRMKGEVMREGDYERQNMLNQTEATDFAYAPITKKEMMRTDEPLLGRRERAPSPQVGPSTSPQAGPSTSAPASSRASAQASPQADPSATSSTTVVPTTLAAELVDSPEIVDVDVAMTDVPPVDPDVAMADIDAEIPPNTPAPARARPHHPWWTWVRRWV